MVLLNVDGLEVLIAIFAAIMFGPPLILIFLGLTLNKKNPTRSKNLFIAAVVYLLVGAGICGVLMN